MASVAQPLVFAARPGLFKVQHSLRNDQQSRRPAPRVNRRKREALPAACALNCSAPTKPALENVAALSPDYTLGEEVRPVASLNCKTLTKAVSSLEPGKLLSSHQVCISGWCRPRRIFNAPPAALARPRLARPPR